LSAYFLTFTFYRIFTEIRKDLKLIFRNKNNRWQNMGDDALLASYRKSGEMEVIEELFNRYGHLVLGVCLKYLKSEDEAKDACMQIFEKLISELKHTEVLQFKSWIHAVTRNHCLLHIRKIISVEEKKNGYLKNFSLDFVDFWMEMNHTYEAELEMKNLHLSMEKLDADQRQCLDLVYFQDKSYQEVSAITGFDLNKVKSYVQNGKRNLKIILGKHHEK